MISMIKAILHASTFNEFKSDNPNKSILFKSAYLSYLALANITAIVQKDLLKFKRSLSNRHKTHLDKVRELQVEYLEKLNSLTKGEQIGSVKQSTHQFSDTVYKPKVRLDTTHFNQAFIDSDGLFVDVEANMTFRDLISLVTKAGFTIPVVPEFLEITVGGAFSGVAIESSCHKYGLFHETVLKAQILMPEGNIETASVTENTELFTVIPGSNGTLGKALYLRIPLIPLPSIHPKKECHPFLNLTKRDAFLAAPDKPWIDKAPSQVKVINTQPSEHVKLTYLRFKNQKDALKEFWKITKAQEADFVESIALTANDIVIIRGDIVKDIDKVSPKHCHNYLTKDVFWDHVTNELLTTNYVPLIDYLSRWNQTIFWNTQNLGAATNILNNRLFRWLFQNHMGTSFMKQLEGSKELWEKTCTISSQESSEGESIVQDLGIPEEYLDEFFEWYDQTIKLYPVWLCPIAPTDGRFPLFTIQCKSFSLDFGAFPGTHKKLHTSGDPNYYTKQIEQWILTHNGIKALYAKNFLSKNDADKMFNGSTYEKLKSKFDPNNRYLSLYDKMIRPQVEKGAGEKPHTLKLPFSFCDYRLWLQCLATSFLGTFITSLCVSISLPQLILLGISTAILANQLSGIMGKIAVSLDYDEQSIMQGFSGWSCVFILASAVGILTQACINPYLLVLGMFCLAAIKQAIQWIPEMESPVIPMVPHTASF